MTSGPTVCPHPVRRASAIGALACALLFSACAGAPTASPPACQVIYRGPDAGEPDRPYFKTLRCGDLEVIVCRSAQPLPNKDCTP